MIVHDETESDIRRLIEADFGLLAEGKRLSDAFLDWLHYRARRIPRVPRQVIVSREVTAKLGQFPAVSRIHAALQLGLDVSAHLNEGVRTDKANHQADMLFNDWQIVHFHLGNVLITRTKMSRTKPVLFAHIAHDKAILLDIRDHGPEFGRSQWTQTELLEILLRADPNTGYQVKGVTGQRLTDQQYSNLRSNRTNTIMEINGKALMPGMGISASGHSSRIMSHYIFFDRHVRHYREMFEKDQVPAEFKQAIYSALGVPVRLGVGYDEGGLSIIEKNRGFVFIHLRPLD